MFLALIPLLTAVAVTPDPAWQSLWQQCHNEKTAELRLACYDALGRGGERQEGMTLPAPSEENFQLQRDADTGDITLVRRLMDGNALVIRCASNITQLRLTLAQPWAGETVTVHLDGRGMADTWFVRNRGQLLEYGRGLPAIETLKRWVGHHELLLGDAEGKQIPILLTGLGPALIPLRQQCRW